MSMIEQQAEERKQEQIDAVKSAVLMICTRREDLEFRYTDGRKVCITVIPHRADYGRLCGRKGKHLRALTDFACHALARVGCEVNLKLEEGPGRQAMPSVFVTAGSDWDDRPTERAGYILGEACFDGKLHVEIEPVNRNTAKMRMIVEGATPSEELESALEILLDCIAASTGRHLVLEVKSANGGGRA